MPLDLFSKNSLSNLLPGLPASPKNFWKPAISCLACSYPNDIDHIFCQRCGFKKEQGISFTPPKQVDVDELRVKKRLESLSSYRSAKSYQRQKSSLQSQLSSYLWSLPEKRTISNASPRDVLGFLAWRDKFGKVILHSDDCLAAPQAYCSCPKTLAAGTIDNNIGKLRSIFRENGRGSKWNEDLHLGNPAAHLSVKEYHRAVLEEQTMARTFPVQATPCS